MHQGDPDETRRWGLTGFRVVLFWLPIVILPILATIGIVVTATAERAPVGFLVVWLGIVVFVGAQFLRQATAIEFDADATVRLHRPLLPDVSVPAADVRRLGLGPIARRLRVGGSARHVEHDADGRTRRVPLAPGMPGLFELGTALRARNPGVEVDLG